MRSKLGSSFVPAAAIAVTTIVAGACNSGEINTAHGDKQPQFAWTFETGQRDRSRLVATPDWGQYSRFRS
jgi:hypothetical protein